MEENHTPQTTLASASDITPDVPRWENARRWVEAATKFARASLACQVMAGFELIELHRSHGIRRGQHKKVMSTRETLLFPDLVERELPVKRASAYRWMQIARFIQEKCTNMDTPERLRALLKSPPNQWSDEESQFVSEFVREITEGKTQLAFMVELGLKKTEAAEQPVEGAVRLAEPSAVPAENIESSLSQETPAHAASDTDMWPVVGRTLAEYGARFVREPDDRIREQVDALDAAIRVRRNWLNLPMELRDPKALEFATDQAQAA